MIYAKEQRLGKAKPVESLDHIERELQNLSLTLQPPPAPTEPFGEEICQYTDTLCTAQKQTASLIPYYNTHHCL